MSRRLPAQRILHVGLACLCLCTARDVAASELIVEWTAPPECPDHGDIVSSVERSLGDPANVNLTATATVTRTAGIFRASVAITSSAGHGERILENTRCELLAESVALVIALSAPHFADAGEHAHDSPHDGLSPALSAHATAVTGLLPRLALGAGGTLALEGFAALRLELGGSYYAQQSSTFDEMSIGGHLGLLGIGLRACRIWTLGAFELAPCLGARFHRIAGMGFGGMVSLDGASLVWGPALGMFSRVRLLQRLALYLSADAVAAVSRRPFVFSDVGVLHRPAAVAFQLFVAPEVRF